MCPAPTQQDLLLLDDLLGIADPDMPLPQIDPDARRRRLTALINAASLARTPNRRCTSSRMRSGSMRSASRCWPTSSRSIPQTPSMVLITYRPEYQGALTRVPGRADDSACPAE